MIVVVEYEDENGSHPFARWFNALNVPAALKVRTALARMENGNFSNVAPVGQGVSECKLDFGPGYRIYFGKDGDKLVILLGGGTKKRITLQAVLIQNPGLTDGAVGIHHHTNFNAQVPRLLGPGGQAPAFLDLLANQINLADGQSAQGIVFGRLGTQGFRHLLFERFLLFFFFLFLLFLRRTGF